MTQFGTFRRSLSLPQVEEITIRTNSSPANSDQNWRVKQRRQQCALWLHYLHLQMHAQLNLR